MAGFPLFRLGSLAIVSGLALISSCDADREGLPAGEARPVVAASARPPLSAEESLDRFVIVDGYRVELVASEPLIADPVSLRFDEHGRMWVTEMRGFMPTIDGDGEDEAVGRVVILEDSDSDGRMDRRVEFLSGLVLPRVALPLGNGEALVLVPPHALHAKDTDGDLVADVVVPLDFELAAEPDNPEYAASSATLGLDNWIYFAYFDRRFRLRDGTWEEEPVAPGGQWGLSMDDHGRWFFNTNQDHLRVHPAPPHYAPRNANIEAPAFVDTRVVESQIVWPAIPTPGVNRGYLYGVLRGDGRLQSFTSACAPVIYRGDLMPEFRGDAFVAEPAAHFIRRTVLTETEGRITGANAYVEREFLASGDERFRPVDLQNGPDGALYIVDMYRGVIQHRHYMTGYLRDYAMKNGLVGPIHLGRIWRVVPDDARSAAREWSMPASSRSPEALLEHANGWVRDTAQRLLVGAPELARRARGALETMARSGVTTVPRLHALWTLEGADLLDRETVLLALRDDEIPVREQGLRLSERWLLGTVDQDILGALELLADSETHLRVALQLALTLGSTDRGSRSERGRAERALAVLLARHGTDERMRDAALSGLAGDEVGFLEVLRQHPDWENESPERQAVLRRIAGAVVSGRSEHALRELLAAAASDPLAWRRRAVLEGAAIACPSEREAPIRMGARPEVLDALLRSDDDRVAAAAARIARALDIGWRSRVWSWLSRQGWGSARGAASYSSRCAACHREDGSGVGGLGPALKGSQRVLGSPEEVIRIVLLGFTSAIGESGRAFPPSIMPPHPGLSDQEVADIVTYIRGAWSNQAESVGADLVGLVRRGGHSLPPQP